MDERALSRSPCFSQVQRESRSGKRKMNHKNDDGDRSTKTVTAIMMEMVMVRIAVAKKTRRDGAHKRP